MIQWLAESTAVQDGMFSPDFIKWIGTNFGFGGIIAIILLVIGRKVLSELREDMRREAQRNRDCTDDSAEAILECTMALPFIAHEHKQMMEKTRDRIRERRKGQPGDS